MKDLYDQDSSIHNLIQSLERELDRPDTKKSGSRVVVFMSARPHEGTSTIARDYAQSLSDSDEHKVLLIDAGRLDGKFYAARNLNATNTLSAAVLSGKEWSDAVSPLGEHTYICRWSPDFRNRGSVSKLMNDKTLWTAMRKTFGTIVIDAPALKDAPDGVAFASMADATVIVVEAEKTRQPVVENLRDALRAAEAKIAGVVLNKRRFYIPDRVYQNM